MEKKRNILLVAFTILLTHCVEQIEFAVPPAERQMVVEGMISDSPGPHRVKITRGMDINAHLPVPAPVENLKVTLFDDTGMSENFTEISPGIYETGGAMTGQVGHAYHIIIETPEGKIFESEPDILTPGGEIENVRFEFEARKVQVGDYELPNDVFNIYVDSRAADGDENYVRWRFTGTYKVVTFPELHTTKVIGYSPYKNPFPCSGYIVVEGVPGGKLEKVDDCTCCTCWVRQFEKKPQLSDNQLVTDNKFNNVKVGEVPINNVTFYEKYLLEVEQMSISRTAFEYFRLIRTQKDGASSLFQPPSGEIRGNIRAVNSNDPVIGLFWATSLRKQSKYIQRTDVPYLLTPITYATLPCYDYYPNASAGKPAQWEE